MNLGLSKTHLIKILNVCETAKGGLASYFSLLNETTCGIARHIFVVPKRHTSDLPPTLEVKGFPDPERGARKLLHLLNFTCREALIFRPDIIFFHSTFTLPVMAVLRFLRVGGAFVYCAHGWAAARYPVGSIKRKIIERIEGYLCALADVVINISIEDLAHARAHKYRGQHCLIENAVLDVAGESFDAPFTREGNEVNLLFVGRFDRQKGVDILIDAFARAQKSRNGLKLHLVGAPVLSGEGNTSGTVLPQNVICHGWLTSKELPAYFANADIVVVPSRWEGFGLVVPEALRAGTPVLVSDRGALPGLVTVGETGFVSKLETNELAEAIVNLDKKKLASMRQNCRSSYEARFHASRFSREVTQLFKKLVK